MCKGLGEWRIRLFTIVGAGAWSLWTWTVMTLALSQVVLIALFLDGFGSVGCATALLPTFVYCALLFCRCVVDPLAPCDLRLLCVLDAAALVTTCAMLTVNNGVVYYREMPYSWRDVATPVIVALAWHAARAAVCCCCCCRRTLARSSVLGANAGVAYLLFGIGGRLRLQFAADQSDVRLVSRGAKGTFPVDAHVADDDDDDDDFGDDRPGSPRSARVSE